MSASNIDWSTDDTHTAATTTATNAAPRVGFKSSFNPVEVMIAQQKGGGPTEAARRSRGLYSTDTTGSVSGTEPCSEVPALRVCRRTGRALRHSALGRISQYQQQHPIEQMRPTIHGAVDKLQLDDLTGRRR